MRHKVLIVDDESTIRDMLQEVLGAEPYDLLSADCAEEGLKILIREKVDVVISDERMPGMTGSEFLSIVNRTRPDTIRMILTGHASLEGAIRSINEGEIYRFFTKPCNVFDLALTVRQALQQKELVRKSRRLMAMAERQLACIEDLEGRYPGITEVKRAEQGAILINDDGKDPDPETLIREIEGLLARCSGMARTR